MATPLNWHLPERLSGFGWPLLVAMALGVLNIAFYFSAARPAQEQKIKLQQEAEFAVEKARRAAKGGQRPAALTPSQELARFNAFFPPLSDAHKWIGEIYAAARGEKLTLERGDYKVLREANGSLARYQITLPLKGTYPQIRRFIVEVLEEIPPAALDDVSIRREKIGDSQIEARVKISLYMKVNNEPLAGGA